MKLREAPSGADAQAQIHPGWIPYASLAVDLEALADAVDAADAALDARIDALETVAIVEATINAQANDYNPTGWLTCDVLKLTVPGSQVVTGFVPFAGLRAVINADAAETLTLAHQHAGSSAANRIVSSTGNLILQPGYAAMIFYDTTVSRTRVLDVFDFRCPAGATDNAIVRFDGATGKLGQNSLVYIDDSGNLSPDGNIVMASGKTVDGVDVSAHAASATAHGISSFAATVLDDANAPAACATLGAEQTSAKNAANGYAGLSAASRTTKGVIATDDLIVDDSAKGLVLKDTAGTPHYWRVSVSVLGILTATDLGTSAP